MRTTKEKVLICHRWRPWLLGIVLALAANTPASANEIQINIDNDLEFAVDNLGGGLFQYDLTLTDHFADPLSGLNILFAHSVFGLTDVSVISAPAGWGFFAPFPPYVNELNWFSLNPGTDVPVGGSLGGFVFLSTTDPATLEPGNLTFDDIDGTTGRQLEIPIPDQPNPVLLLTTGLVALLAMKHGLKAFSVCRYGEARR
jgi:hypothetical protein